MTAHKIGMGVGFKYRYNTSRTIASKFKIRVGVSARVNQCHLTVAEYRIGSMRKVAVIKLLDLHS